DCLGRAPPTRLRRYGATGSLSRRSPRSGRSRRTPDTKYAGGHRIRVTPVPIPNTEVKPDTADGTARETGWESRSLPAVFVKKPDVETRRAFALYANARLAAAV